jgi:hypothetical protein
MGRHGIHQCILVVWGKQYRPVPGYPFPVFYFDPPIKNPVDKIRIRLQESESQGKPVYGFFGHSVRICDFIGKLGCLCFLVGKTKVKKKPEMLILRLNLHDNGKEIRKNPGKGFK